MLRQNRLIIDMDAIRHNYRILREKMPAHTAVMPVIKANAYGHGMLEAAQALEAMGAEHFAVALPDEGVELRLAGVKGEILVLGPATPSAAAEAVRWDLTQTVFTPEMVRLLDQEAANQNTQALVHIKLDTGMNRIGLRTSEEAAELAQAINEAVHVRVTGVYTHFADADAPGGFNAFSQEQLKRYCELRAYFPSDVPSHTANSATALLKPEAYFDMVREGIALYGYPPVETDLPFKPALSWLTEVTHVKDVKAGETIGYGRTFTAPKDMRIATIAVGYGDGYHRSLSNCGEMLIRGRRAPILGRVCMDQTMVDVTDIPSVQPGDETVLIGCQGNEKIDAEMVADWAGTISYEVLLAVTQRVPRVYENV